jgi:hypothetical protein
MYRWRTVPAGLLLCTLVPAAWLIVVPGAIADREFGSMFAALVLSWATVVLRNRRRPDENESRSRVLSRTASSDAARLAVLASNSRLGSCSNGR